ncbi:MAG: DUF5688 family protein [Lachnospiraceae bacterium]|nr:DUF5688 family protein [Lachnospiraceae bacterium]MDD7665172.1 DUF5688 family protein [Lachnospiraceae bacterium]MDY4165058.1 DUF5688 family protein [Lachnospiraceae bacterium]
MNYEIFKTNLFNTIETRLGAKVLSGPDDISCFEMNGLSVNACVISIPGRNFYPVIYPDLYFDKYRKGSTFEEIVENVLDVIRYTNEDTFNFDEISDYEKAKEHIVPRLVSYSVNPEIFERRAYVPYLNIAVVFIYVISSKEDELVSFAINDEQVRTWGVSVKEIFRDSIETSTKLFPPLIESIKEALPLIREEDFRPFYVLTNSRKQYGAACVLYDNVLSDFAEKIGESFFLIPSSVHEMLLIPESFDIRVSEMRQMLLEVNDSVLKPEEVLSDRVYYFDMKNKKLDFASKD